MLNQIDQALLSLTNSLFLLFIVYSNEILKSSK